MAAFRDDELLLTDIDNRAVRRVTVADGRVSTVPYDDGHLYTRIWGDRFPAAKTPLPKASRALPGETGHTKVTAAEAAAACKSEGAALCPPSALREDAVMARFRDGAAWTGQARPWPRCPRSEAPC